MKVNVNPRLLVVAGPLKGSTYVFSGKQVHIGRDPSNTLTISDPALSPQHCVLTNRGDDYVIRDLGSLRGTFVNGIAVQESPVGHGDQISVGDSVFLLMLQEQEHGHASGPVEFKDDPPPTRVQLRLEAKSQLPQAGVGTGAPESSRIAKKLDALMAATRIVRAIRELEPLQAKILELLFEIVPAERAAILLQNENGEQFGSLFARHRVPRGAQPISVSRSIVRQVMEQGIAVLGTAVGEEVASNRAASVLSSTLQSLLCVPLSQFHTVTGCIYLARSDGDLRFDEDHLQLVTAVADVCALALSNARQAQRPPAENLRPKAEPRLDHDMVGDSPRMREIYHFLARVSPKESTVLIEGESGTGKELAAKAIHRNSPRAARPFIAINCATIPEGLLESELFGHEKGAFTDAIVQKRGRLELANGGVVFLDEIGELAPALQVKLLRVLQEREFERVGGTRPISVDIRLIAATNRHLAQAVKAGQFRADLFYRLNVVNLVMPPLRERREDIPRLAEHFVAKFSTHLRVQAKSISPEAMSRLVSYHWPGNVRELENAIERALVMSASDTIGTEDLPAPVLRHELKADGALAKYHAAVQETKKQLIRHAVQEANGNYTEAARLLGVHPNYLHRLIRNLGLKPSLRFTRQTEVRENQLPTADARDQRAGSDASAFNGPVASLE